LPSKQLNKEGESDLAFFFAGWAESATNSSGLNLDSFSWREACRPWMVKAQAQRELQWMCVQFD
jgi:hypothetical protein